MSEKGNSGIENAQEYLMPIFEEERFPIHFGKSTVWYRRISAEGMKIILEVSQMENGEFDENAFIQSCVEQCMVDWENVKHPVTGEDIPFSVEIALKFPRSFLLDFTNNKIMGGRIPDDLLRGQLELKNLRGTASLK